MSPALAPNRHRIKRVLLQSLKNFVNHDELMILKNVLNNLKNKNPHINVSKKFST